ncbi:MAG: type IX secretion system membrane protein PorP/SprF [Bacteroidales bacterium]|nr:type IX secretion system membrane protein PorP/SprF [Bacteroidales bacterium]
MKKTFAILLLITAGYWANAQQDPQYSLNSFNNAAINPGYAGSNEMICAKALMRQQWMGFENAPKTTVFNINAPIEPGGVKSGVGLTIISDQLGFESNLHIKGAYAYRMELGDGMLGIGLGLGLINKSIDGDWASPASIQSGGNVFTDPSIPHMDSRMTFDMDFGAYYVTDEYFAGLSTTHITKSTLKVDDKQSIFNARHYYIAAGYHYQLPNPLLMFSPSLLMKTDGATTQFNINALLTYNKKFSGGVAYSVGDAITPMIVGRFGDVQFALAYDIGLSDIAKYNNGSLEIMVGYCFTITKDTKTGRYKSVRFLN